MAEKLLLDLNKELQLSQTPLAQKPCYKSIYRVPKNLTDVNKQAYEPILASFGPYHHNSSHLRQMEESKLRALVQFHLRIAKASKTPADVLNAMRSVERRLIAYYDDFQVEKDDENVLEPGIRLDVLMETDEFLKIMIIDGCFALEIMLAEKRFIAWEPSEYDPHDPIFGVERLIYVLPNLKRDMLLLENQLPLLALTTLAAIDGSGIGDVQTLIKGFYNLSLALPKYQIYDECFHILDLYRKIMTSVGEYVPTYEENLQSATKLRNAGILFCKSKTNSFKDISFNGNILYLPQLKVDDNTESYLLNLIAFERLHAGNEVRAYAFFMNNLIYTEDDVALLIKEEIITGFMGRDGSISEIFKSITNEAKLMIFTDGNIVGVNNKLNAFFKKRIHRWRANFVGEYLNDPCPFTLLLFFVLLGSFVFFYLIIVHHDKA